MCIAYRVFALSVQMLCRKKTHTSKTDPQNLQIESVKRKLNEAERKKDKCNITPYVRGDSCLSVNLSVCLLYLIRNYTA